MPNYKKIINKILESSESSCVSPHYAGLLHGKNVLIQGMNSKCFHAEKEVLNKARKDL